MSSGGVASEFAQIPLTRSSDGIQFSARLSSRFIKTCSARPQCESGGSLWCRVKSRGPCGCDSGSAGNTQDLEVNTQYSILPTSAVHRVRTIAIVQLLEFAKTRDVDTFGMLPSCLQDQQVLHGQLGAGYATRIGSWELRA